MKTFGLSLAAFWLTFTLAAATPAAPAWTEGKSYFLIEPPRPPTLPRGKVAVTEVFSYACPACNHFLPIMHQLVRSLPANAVVDYLPASFNSSEDWPMFQLAYCTAQALGIADQWHDAMFDAVWQSNELAVIDPATGRIKDRLPAIEDAARFYNRHAGVPVEKFLSTAKSFAVDFKVRSDEDLIKAYGVDRTPTIVVNGKYRLHVQSAGGTDELIELVKWLVAKESK
ncbi:MAG TPA: thiol:disulfide interchange protein DsbA/DsbL [Steroidobacteraceae bacterium]|nr:thiol:disulfide interchange protein DsbA/DsbL [Steroidobacteraceae bacterium]